MLSLLPAMLRLSMEELAPALPLRREIRAALEGALSPERTLLSWLECYEHADWAGCDALAEASGLDPTLLAKHYAGAVAWAEAALRSVA